MKLSAIVFKFNWHTLTCGFICLDLGELIKSKIVSLDTGVWGCKDCGYQTSYKTTLSRKSIYKYELCNGLVEQEV